MLRKYWAELLTSMALLGGWSLITWGVARLSSPLTWVFSAGVLLISLAGWRMLWEIAARGLYALMRKPRRGR